MRKHVLFGVVGFAALALLGCRSVSGGDGFGDGANTTPLPTPVNDPNMDADASDDTTVKKGILEMKCDGESSLAIDNGDAMNAALAIGLCPPSQDSEDPWGLVSARYTMPDGTGAPAGLSHGILPDFGTNVTPLQGERLLVLSTGTARRPNDQGYQAPTPSGFQITSGWMNKKANPPAGFPVNFQGCPPPEDKHAFDGMALEVVIKTPANAKSMRFNVNFYTAEFPEWVCSEYNDFFVALQTPAPKNAKLGNVAFDVQSNPISVNNAYVEVCEAQSAGRAQQKTFPCRLGTAQLEGTGFEGNAASGWLEVTTPVKPSSEVTLRLAIWDTGDMSLSSTVLVDRVRFDVEDIETPEVTPIL